jgi:hypothetical protein
MSKKYYVTFREEDPYHGCLRPVYANHEDQVRRLVLTTHGNGFESIYDEQEGRVIKDNSGLVVLDPIGIE